MNHENSGTKSTEQEWWKKKEKKENKKERMNAICTEKMVNEL